MIDSAAPVMSRLSPVRCGQCNRPVTHVNKTVPRTEAGAFCTNCKQDERGRIRIFTCIVVAPCECGCHP